MKKTVGIICALAMGLSTLSLVACGGGAEAAAKEKTVMNVSLNPQVEFVLDGDDKVLSVNALNEEGNLVISAEAFNNVEGKSAEEAAQLFVQVSKDTGFIVEGNATAGDNKLEFSFSGNADDAKELFDSVKAKVDGYLSEANVTATIEQAVAITEAQLEALVAECAPYMEAAQVQAMEYAELVDELVKSRKETAELYSQELKNAYYEAKAFAFEQAELEFLKSKVNVFAQAAIDAVSKVYFGIVENVEKVRFDNFVSEDSLYQKALATFREAKVEYINFKNYVASLEQDAVTTAISGQLAALQTAVDNAEKALVSAGEYGNNLIDTAKARLKSSYDAVIKAIEDNSVKASDYLNEISTVQKEALTEFTTEFEATYSEVVTAAENNWKAMSEKLQAGYTPEATE